MSLPCSATPALPWWNEMLETRIHNKPFLLLIYSFRCFIIVMKTPNNPQTLSTESFSSVIDRLACLAFQYTLTADNQNSILHLLSLSKWPNTEILSPPLFFSESVLLHYRAQAGLKPRVLLASASWVLVYRVRQYIRTSSLLLKTIKLAKSPQSTCSSSSAFSSLCPSPFRRRTGAEPARRLVLPTGVLTGVISVVLPYQGQ